MVLHSFAKLNLYLEVLNKREDNYHNIKTVFERIDLSDKIVLKPRTDNKIKIISKNFAVPKGYSNLCYRSAKLLQESFNLNRGLDIEITKRIPVGAGLGGGSSNAAVVLLGLNKLWKLKLCKKKLAELAKRIGCDVPFFVYDIAFAQGDERGDKVKPLNMLGDVRFWHVLVVPKIKVSTRFIYAKWDTYSGLTRPRGNVKILPLALRQNDPSLIGKSLFNALERITIKLYPEVRRVKEGLLKLGLKSILMSGSGPAVFGFVSSRKEALSVSRQLQKQDRSWQVYATRTF